MFRYRRCRARLPGRWYVLPWLLWLVGAGVGAEWGWKTGLSGEGVGDGGVVGKPVSRGWRPVGCRCGGRCRPGAAGRLRGRLFHGAAPGGARDCPTHLRPPHRTQATTRACFISGSRSGSDPSMLVDPLPCRGASRRETCGPRRSRRPVGDRCRCLLPGADGDAGWPRIFNRTA